MPGLLEVPDGMAEADRRAMGAPQGTPTGPSPEPARRAPPSRRSEVFRRHPLDLWTGAPWSELPRRYGSPTTCWRRLFTWEEDGTLLNLWRAFLADLNDREKLRWDECFADGSFAPAKKGGSRSGRRSEAKVRSGCFWSMARVLRWEHTWTRRPRRRSSSSRRPSPPSP